MDLSFLKQCNPVSNWTLGTLEFDDSHTLTCPIHPRHANVDVINDNLVAREVMTKQPSIVFFCAILNDRDATSASYTDETLNADI
jgi:hypothetical protein